MLLLSAPALTDQVYASLGTASPDTTQVKQVVNRFHEAMTNADSASVAAVLSDDVIILEGGRTQTKTQYLSHHFHNDVAYLGAMTREPLQTRVSESGDTAWVVSITRLHGTYRDREMDSNSAELVVLRKSDNEWEIVVVHWSSGKRSN